VDALVDERALREIYLASFEHAVISAKPATIMAAYNRLNGEFCGENAELLTRILRGDWGYDGAVVSDWGAAYDRVAGLRAGLDLQMPGYHGQGDADVIAAIEDGTLPADALDRAATAVLGLIEQTKPAREPGHTYDRDTHHALARRAAAAGTVLLRNEGGLLPLTGAPTIALIGAFARAPRYQGAGSSGINPQRLDNLAEELAALVPEERLRYADGYPRDRIDTDAALLAEACTLAAAVDVAIVVVGLPEAYEIEGLDRTHLNLPPGHDALVDAVVAVSPNVVVVMCNGAPVMMPWSESVAAIVEAYLGGEAGGSALASVLLGRAEPGGRLAETFPQRLSDNPAHTQPNGPRQVMYRESIYVGYRFYDSAGVDVAFPFGHGLSYTTFEWSPVTLSSTLLRDGEPLEVSVTVTNTGTRAGSDVVQVYVHDLEPRVFRPAQELAGFAKVHLEPGESQRVTVVLDRRAFAFWDTRNHEWYVDGGTYEIRAGASSRDIRSASHVQIRSGEPDRELDVGPGVYHRIQLMHTLDDESFAALYGPLPDEPAAQPGHYTVNTRIAEMRHPVARLLRNVMKRRVAAVVKQQQSAEMALMITRMVDEATPRMLPLMSRGAMSAATAVAFTRLANGHPVAGMRALWRARRLARRERRAEPAAPPPQAVPEPAPAADSSLVSPDD
jgi:beta-glucosidase